MTCGYLPSTTSDLVHPSTLDLDPCRRVSDPGRASSNRTTTPGGRERSEHVAKPMSLRARCVSAGGRSVFVARVLGRPVGAL